MEDLLRAHRLDQEYRYPGTVGGLYSYEEVRPNCVWDFKVPTLLYCTSWANWDGLWNSHPVAKLEHPTNLEEFRIRWQTHYPFLENLNYNKILIAGGCLARLLRGKVNPDTGNMSRDERIVDIDVFFYDCTRDQAIQKIKEIAQMFEGAIVTHLRSGQAITIVVDHYKLNHFEQIQIQFIFRIYSSISEILYGFDLPSSAVGFDGQRLYFTANSKFAYEYGLNYIDTSRRSTTYEWRLNKYFQRGFGIVFPHLKYDSEFLAESKEHSRLILPGLAFELIRCPNCLNNDGGYYPGMYNYYPSDRGPRKIPFDRKRMDRKKCQCSFTKNPMHLCGFLLRKTINNVFTPWRLGADYWNAPNSDYWEAVIDSEGSYGFHWVAMILNKNLYHLMQHYDGEKEDQKGQKDKNPGQRVRPIMVINRDLDEILNNFLGMTDFIIKKYRRIKENLPNQLKGPIIDTLLNKMCQKSLEAMHQFNLLNYQAIQFITKNPGTQLTSSFNPIIEEEWKWYGPNNYVPGPVVRRKLLMKKIKQEPEQVEELFEIYGPLNQVTHELALNKAIDVLKARAKEKEAKKKRLMELKKKEKKLREKETVMATIQCDSCHEKAAQIMSTSNHRILIRCMNCGIHDQQK